MRQPNGYGSISKLSGTRRKPWMVRITTGFSTDFDLQRTKQIQKVLGYYETRKEAMQALAAYHDNPFDLEAAKITFRQCYEEAKKGFTKARAHNYRSAFRFLEPIADLPIGSIKAAQMQKCVDSCQTTQQRDIKTVCRKTFEYALQNDIVDRNPALYVHSNTVDATIERDVFTPDQIRDMVEHSDGRYEKMALILLYTGMRTKELLDLNPEDVDLDQRMINIRIAKNKSSVRSIPIHDAILAHISDFIKEPKHCCYESFNHNIMAKYGRRPHDCRHTFTTRMRECGCDLLVLQILLGHTPQTITERIYTHVSMEELKDAINALDYGLDSCYI